MEIAASLVEMGKYGIRHLINVLALKLLIGMDLFVFLALRVKYGTAGFLHVCVLLILNGMDLTV